jgi:hypothetical protein
MLLLQSLLLGGLSNSTVAPKAPNAPTSLEASAGSPAYSVAGLSWTASAADGTHNAAATYTVQYEVTGAGSWSTFATGVTGTTESVTGLAHDTAYSFQVIAVNTGGNATSSSASLTTDYAAPNAPVISAVAPVNDGTATKLAVTWAASATDSSHDAATGYNLQYSVHAANSWTAVSSVSSGAVITGLTAGTSYDVQVQGTNASTSSPGAWSASTTASTYSTVLSWITQTTPETHGTGSHVFSLHTTPNPSGAVGVDFYWSTSTTTNTNTQPGPQSSLGSGGYPINGNQWGAYMTAPAAAGTYYCWGIVNDNSGAIISEAITVT